MPDAGKLTRKARLALMAAAEQAGAAIRRADGARPVAADVTIPLGLAETDREALLRAMDKGWHRIDALSHAGELTLEGRRLFKQGAPMPVFPVGHDLASAIAAMQRVSAIRGGWLRAETDAKEEARMKRVLAKPEDSDHRGNVTVTAERKTQGGLRRVKVALGTDHSALRDAAHVQRDQRPTELHRLAAQHPVDITRKLVAAGMRLRADFENAGLVQRTVGAYSPLGGGGAAKPEMTNAEVKAEERYQRAMKDAFRLIAERNAVQRVVIDELPGQGSRLDLLKTGLTALARYYESTGVHEEEE